MYVIPSKFKSAPFSIFLSFGMCCHTAEMHEITFLHGWLFFPFFMLYYSGAPVHSFTRECAVATLFCPPGTSRFLRPRNFLRIFFRVTTWINHVHVTTQMILFCPFIVSLKKLFFLEIDLFKEFKSAIKKKTSVGVTFWEREKKKKDPRRVQLASDFYATNFRNTPPQQRTLNIWHAHQCAGKWQQPGQHMRQF